MKSKECTVCKVTKPVSEFYKNKPTYLGVAVNCKECCKKRGKKYYSNNKDKAKVYYYKKRATHYKELRANAKSYYNSCKDGLYHVYFLPEEHYCGQTNNIKWRKWNHNSKGRLTDGLEIVMSFKTRNEAKLMEAHFHALGWYGKRFKDPAYCLKTRKYKVA